MHEAENTQVMVESKGRKSLSLVPGVYIHTDSVGRVCPSASFRLAPKPGSPNTCAWSEDSRAPSLHLKPTHLQLPADYSGHSRGFEICSFVPLFCAVIIFTCTEGWVKAKSDLYGARCLSLFSIPKWRTRLNSFTSQGNRCGSIGTLQQKFLDQIHFSQCTDCQLLFQHSEKHVFLTLMSVCVDFEFGWGKKPLTSRNYRKKYCSCMVWQSNG